MTKPSKYSPRGLYIDANANYAPPDRNLYTRDFQTTLFYIGPFDSRPADMVSVGYAKTYFSSDARTAYVKRKIATESDRDGPVAGHARLIYPK